VTYERFTSVLKGEAATRALVQSNFGE
jgi:hypothetical protein